MTKKLPRFIALCGAPESGKSTIQKVLEGQYNCQSVDDGLILRKACMELYGLTWEDVSTQEGKAKDVVIDGTNYKVRQLLGDIGVYLEHKHGANFVPLRAIASTTGITDKDCFVFGSVRKNQAKIYRDNGGICLEVIRPGKVIVNDFDKYNKDNVDVTLMNDKDEATFKDKVVSVVELIKSGLVLQKGIVI